ncbi:Down syndrome cell adhesion molecule-like protein Dscam2 [Cimex lectularius]|uniref:Down syndrome cell adhesion molecule-like protein Dscam2 n=1 Tax=Cimex lectularius TaxID=79782 RepID=A0A8I6S5Y8_CIMLE|nr:Down syndrome cell adhesion molecule-like protein Dscam2 [Cimex lectularius]
MSGKIRLIWFVLLIKSGFGLSVEMQGPHFIVEPPHKVEFSNSSGAKIDCSAHSSPPSKIDWVLGDGSPVTKVPDLREVLSNGTLVFPPFPAELYRHDVHNVVYKCRASNPLGIIISKDVHLRAVVKQKYEVQVSDEYVISGNTAVLRCQVPSYAAEFTIVTSWIQEGVINIYPNTDTGGKFAVMSNGDLYVYRTSQSDGYKTYGCRTVHKLTGDVRASSYPGRIIITEPKGAVQPRIRVEKHSRKQVKYGEDIILPCLAQGYPIPTYRWFREESEKLMPVIGNERIHVNPSGLLYITKSRIEDKGKYICKINNTVGEEVAQVTLSVTAPLSVHIHPQTQVVDVGKEALLQCTPNGFPVTRVFWFHNGQPLTTDSKYKVSTNQLLNISSISKDDQGMYQCFVSNDWDMAQAVAELQLGDASPELTYSFSEQTLQPGPPISLKCVATGNPPPQFTWLLDGFPIPDSTRFLVGQYVTIHDDVVSHVNISSVKVEDGGEYSCIAKNTVTEILHSARINIYGPPFIRVMPKLTAVAGSDLIIKCPVAGYPIETITWERDGTILPTNRRQRVYPNGTLIIEQAQKGTDGGTYTCQAQSRQKHIARRDVEVQVILPPKILPIQAMTNLLREGMRAAISCQVIEGDLPFTFKWQRNGRDDIGSGTIIRRLDEYSTALVIEKIAATHSANYTCIVENKAGSESFTVPLTVNVPPRWTIEPSDTNVILGYDITLDCQADGYPQPAIIWRKAVGDHPGEYKDFLYEPNINFYRNGSLEFSHISKESEGHYLCEAKNGIANGVSKVIFLKVNSPANFPQKSKQIHVEKGGQAHIQCTALGDNPIQIMWKVGPQKVGEDFDPRYSVREQLLDEGMVSELGISHVFRHDTGVLSCYATNSYGHDEMTIHLVVQEPPELPKNIRVVDQQSRTLQLSWTQPYAGNSPVTSYIIQYKLISEPWEAQPSKIVVPGTQTMATVTNLHPATSYHLRILAENKLGFSDPSEVIQVTTQEEVPSGPPQDIRVEARSSTELFVQWEPPAREFWNGNLLGYHIGYTKMGNTASNMQVKTVEIGSQYGGQAILDNLAMFTSYSIVINAFNSRGPGPNSGPVRAQTKEGVPTAPPEKINCMTISSTTLEIWWDLPSVENRNGHIQGYKINYYPCEEWYETANIDIKATLNLRTTLTGLLKFTNYSISILAYTKSGDGVPSAPIFCRTAEDVPTAPEDIKVVMSNINQVLVSWLPPKQFNGDLSGYTFYMGMVENGKEGGTHKHVLSPNIHHHEIIQIQDAITYQFWVTASTKVGEGSSTRVVTITPTSKIPARIVSFSRNYHTPWKHNITLECKIVGIPLPKISWMNNGKLITSNSNRLTLKKDGSLLVRDIQFSDRGNYSCHIENQFGEDSIVYNVIVRIPPDPPVLSISNVETDSLHLKWKMKSNYDIPVLGYIINYKREHGDWEEIQIKGKENFHILQNLWCGTRYQLYITAFNKIGTGLPCDIVNASTKGTAPVKPTATQLLTFNSTAITIWLDVWGDGGCEVLYFMLEYRDERRSDWILISNHIKAKERVYTINDLQPATRYFIKVTAYNNAGSNLGIYNITTLASDGTPILPKAVPSPDLSSSAETYVNMKIIWTIIFIVLPVLSISMGCLYLRKRKEDIHCGMGESPSVAQMQNLHNRDQQYAVHSGPTHTAHSIDSTTYKTDSTDYIEDVCPYATFQLTKSPYPESTFSGNVYSGPYHSVRGSFVYHDLPSTGDTYKGRHSKDPEYTKVRRKPIRLRDPHSESQESDNLGSTDSEVKKILTLHLPISEYDTHGSDSDIDSRGIATNQDLVSFRHRLSRDMNKGGEESSSSSERSPTGARMQCPHNRKIKNKMQSNKKHHKNNGYSSHTEETSFSFNDRINPPCRFSDPRCRPRDLAELDCDISNMGLRRSSRGSVATPYRLSRESTFQIDV